MNAEIKALGEKAKQQSEILGKVLVETGKVIVGQEEVQRKLLIGLISDGHVLLEGVPGLAKTLMVKTLSECFSVGFVRIQFTPDLLPADIVGTKIYDSKEGKFYSQKGPIFHNFILADEINRAPPKVQSALLEAMQERQVTIHGETFDLPEPFLVLATQNPIESEGTYKLPEAQVDRFCLKLIIDYPTKEDEVEIIRRNTQGLIAKVTSVLSAKEVVELQKFVKKIYADEKIESYVTSIVDATRHPGKYGLDDLKGMIDFGASPRASIWMILTAKANALIEGRGYVIPEDIKALAHDVLRHRIILSFEAEANDLTADAVITKILAKVKAP